MATSLHLKEYQGSSGDRHEALVKCACAHVPHTFMQRVQRAIRRGVRLRRCKRTCIDRNAHQREKVETQWKSRKLSRKCNAEQ
eukprot:1182209-Pleurochrysis_carterae.AAC.1